MKENDVINLYRNVISQTEPLEQGTGIHLDNSSCQLSRLTQYTSAIERGILQETRIEFRGIRIASKTVSRQSLTDKTGKGVTTCWEWGSLLEV